jgi:uncharacterized protein (TIGR00730 family)
LCNSSSIHEKLDYFYCNRICIFAQVGYLRFFKTGKLLMIHKKRVKRLFRSARQELKHAMRPTTSPAAISSSYKLAFSDQGFLLREELRPVRLQLELLKPELIQNDAKIHSTVVIFGSARIPETAVAHKHLETVRASLAESPDDMTLQRKVPIAEKILIKSQYYAEARKLARIISEEGKDEEGNPLYVATGGGPGIMEAANRGAYDIDAKNIGLNIVLPIEQGPNPYITPELCFQFHYFAVRKMHFLIRAKALVVFPGGFGTLDELFEALTLVQTRKVKPMPIVLVGKDYWTRLINFEMLVEEGVIDAEDLRLFGYADTGEDAWRLIKHFYAKKN